MWWMIMACTGTPLATGDPTPCIPETVEDARLAVTYTDFTSGVLGFATDDTLDCPLQGGASIGGDPIVRWDGEQLYVVKRSDADVVSAYDPLEPFVPLWETPLPAGTNAHDVVLHDGRLWIPSFGTGAMITLDPMDGRVLESVVIGQTLDRAAVVDGRLFVADQRFSIRERQDGVLLEVDPVTLGVVSTRSVGANPRIRPTADGFLVATGYYALAPTTYEQDLVDGDVRVLDVIADVLSEPMLLEQDVVGDVHTLVPTPTGFVAVIVDRAGESSIVCQSGDEQLAGPTTPGWFIEGVALGEKVVFATRSTLVGGEESTTPPGLLTLDSVTCSEVSFTESTLQPYDLVAL